MTAWDDTCFAMRDLVLTERTFQDPERGFGVVLAGGEERPCQAWTCALGDRRIRRPMTYGVRGMPSSVGRSGEVLFT